MKPFEDINEDYGDAEFDGDAAIRDFIRGAAVDRSAPSFDLCKCGHKRDDHRDGKGRCMERACLHCPRFRKDEQKKQQLRDSSGMEGETRYCGPRPAEISDREEARTQGVPYLPSAYRSIIGDTPRCNPGDRATAQRFLEGIERAIEVGGWKRTEWARLHKLRKKWRLRALGLDPRFEEVGNLKGGLLREEAEKVKQRASIIRVKLYAQNDSPENYREPKRESRDERDEKRSKE